jgi:hypothetical protein
MAFDTSDTVILGQGTLSLRDEELDLVLRPQPGPLLARAALAAVLYAVAPPAALLALIETGPGEDVGCRSAVESNTRRRPPNVHDS